MSGPELALAGQIFSGVSTVSGFFAGKQQAKYNAQVAENDATAARQKADLDEKRKRDETLRLLGTQRAKAAASGIEVSSGSILDVQADTAVQSELDALAIRYGGQLGVNAAKQKAGLAKASAPSILGAAGNAGGTILTAYGDYKQATK